MHVTELRKKIDTLDRRLVELLNSRARVAVQIGQLKQARESDGGTSADNAEATGKDQAKEEEDAYDEEDDDEEDTDEDEDEDVAERK